MKQSKVILCLLGLAHASRGPLRDDATADEDFPYYPTLPTDAAADLISATSGGYACIRANKHFIFSQVVTSDIVTANGA